MRRAVFCTAVAILLVHALAVQSPGQAVRVGPGAVRAPYAAVDWLPNGAVHVRAPFVNVYSPAFPWGPPFPVPRPFPGMLRSPWNRPVEPAQRPEELGSLDWGTLRRSVAQWTAELDFDLGQISTGELWKAHLKTAELAALVRSQQDAPPGEQERIQLREILAIHQATARSSAYRRITDQPSFRALGAVLAEYTTTADERLRRQLFAAAGELDRSLEQFETGNTWQQYLEVAPGKSLAADQTGRAPASSSTTALADVLARFESVRHNDDYRVIAAVPAFKATHDLLAAYLSRAGASSTAGVEELPIPSPAATQ